MRPILILTKNLLAEQSFQNVLQSLNYEVFCSVELLKCLENKEKALQISQGFQAIVFSEVLTDQEIQKALTHVNIESSLLIRKCFNEPSSSEKEELVEMGINMWIYREQNIDILRELLSIELNKFTRKKKKRVLFYRKTVNS